jgi:hypothetical protein
LAFPGTGNLAGKKEQGTGVYFSNAKISSKSNRFEEKTNRKGAPRMHQAPILSSFMCLRTYGSTRLCG